MKKGWNRLYLVTAYGDKYCKTKIKRKNLAITTA